MREIRFRAWSRHNEKFRYFDLFEINKGLLCSIDEEDNIPQQYTGLKDKNGVEIYEGDIIKDDYWWVGKATVEYANGMFGFEGGDKKPDFRPMLIQFIECEHIEVIGNIFEGVDK